MKDFLRGLSSIHPMPFCAAMVIFLLCLVFCEIALKEQWHCGLPESRLRLSARDDFLYISCQVADLKPSSSHLYFMGGSAVREAFSSDELLEKELAKHGQNWKVHNLSTRAQTLAESIQIIEHLPENSGIVFLAISPGRLNHSEQKIRAHHKVPRLFLTSPGLDEFLGAKSVFLRGAFDRAARYLWAHKKKLTKGQVPNVAYVLPPRFFHVRGVSSEKRESLIKKQVQFYEESYSEQMSFSRGLLELAQRTAEKRGLKLVLLDLPIAPGYRAKLRELYRNYAETLEGLEPVFSFDESKFTSEDFLDLHHFYENGRKKFDVLFTLKFMEWIRARSLS